MADLKVKCAAYHEAGHIVVAAHLGLPLRRSGIHINADGKGIAFYRYRSPDWDSRLCPEITFEQSIEAALAGQIAQTEYCKNCPANSGSSDDGLVEELLQCVPTNRDELRAKLEQDARDVIKKYWKAIDRVSTEVLNKPTQKRNPLSEPDHGWSISENEQQLDGERLIAILRESGIAACIWVDPREQILD